MRTVAALAFALVAACEASSPAPSGAQAQQVPARQSSADASRRTAITNAIERVAPAVVTVQTVSKERVPIDPWEAFFGGGRTGERVQAGLGSGFIIRNDGVIVTNAHVIAGATNVSVAMRDGTTYDAKVVGADELSDVAVLRIDAKNLPVATLGNSSGAIVGEWAIAIGNPYGFVIGNPEPSVTVGVVSGIGRNLVTGAEGGGLTYDMIQTDAAINVGNSGGPLVNAVGEVVGMNTVIYTPSQGSVGLGFAVPVNRVRRVADDLLANGRIARPWIGVKLRVPQSDNPRDAIAMGAVVGLVVQGSPAATAGMQIGDQILRLGSQPIRNYYAWESARNDLRVGDQAVLHLKRGARELDVTVRVADEPEVTAPKVQVLKELQLVTLTPAIRGDRNIQSTKGALVYDASANITNAWGVQKGDVIVRVGAIDVASADAVAKAFDEYAGKGAAYLYIERQGRTYRLVFQIGK